MKYIFAILTFLVITAGANAGEWKDLFDGKTLKGWERHGGKATYEVVDGAIVGTSAPNTQNTFLCTDREYGDFVLEYEYFPHPTLNCGVQFRSKIREKDDRVWGYQCEIDPSNRKWSAGIFEEAARGWLYPVERPKAKAAYKPGEWNKVRIVCLGPVCRTYLNDIPVAQIVDVGNKEGIIGLQVHTVGGNKTPMQIKYRKIRIKELDADDTTAVIAADGDTMGMPPPRGADILLARGKGLEEWKLRPTIESRKKLYEKGKLQWAVDKEDGVATPKPLTGSMVTKKNYGKQQIHVEFCTPTMKEGEKPEVSGNSGVYVQGRYELQICNSYGLDPASNLCGGIYRQHAPLVNAARKPGEWQTYDIYFIPAVYKNGEKTANARLSAKLNGQWVQKDVELMGSTAVGDSENDSPGLLMLQEHQNLVKFRNVWVSDIDNPKKLTKYDPRRR